MDYRFRAARSALTAWLEERAPRERWLLMAGGALAFAAIVYNLLWEPAYDGRAKIAASLPLLETQLADMRPQLDDARRLKVAAAVRAPTGAGLRDALAASLAQLGFVNAQLTLVGTAVQVDAKGVPFAAWMAWLDQMRREQRVRVMNLHAAAEGKPGMTTVSATLQAQPDR